MNFHKYFEAAFIGVTAVAITGAALLMPRSAPVPMQDTSPMYVVVVSAKRLTLEEKLQSLREERQLAQGRYSVARS